MNATERRTLRCMYVLTKTLVQGPVSWTVIDDAGAVQWFTTTSVVNSLVAQGMVVVTLGSAALTSMGIGQASSDPIPWDGMC